MVLVIIHEKYKFSFPICFVWSNNTCFCVESILSKYTGCKVCIYVAEQPSLYWRVLPRASRSTWSQYIKLHNFTQNWIIHYYTHHTKKLLGGILVSLGLSVRRSVVRPSVRQSVRPASRVHSVAPTVLVGAISYLYISSSNSRRCVMCKVQNFKIWIFGNFFKVCNFDFLLFWLGIWCESLVWLIMWRLGGISEGRHSSYY